MNTTKKQFLAISLFTCLMAVLMAGVFIFANGNTAAAQTTCVDYWTPGPSNCQPEKPKKPEQPQPQQKQQQSNQQAEFIEPENAQPFQNPPEEKEEAAGEEEMTAEEKKEAKMQKDVKKFYQRHGKPPEEFVRFHMDPSPENAIAWVKKYNENLERSRQLSSAWTQAQKIYDQFEQQGMDIPPEMLPEYAKDDKNALPPVQKFDEDGQITSHNNASSNSQDPTLANNESLEKSVSVGSLNNNGAEFSVAISADGRIGANLPPEALTEAPQNTQNNSLSNAAQTSSHGGSAQRGADGSGAPLEISYYFSADCPYCKRFEPGFIKVLKDMPGNPKVTCVDMTPQEQTQANVHGNIDCEWRPLMEGEMNAMGVEATPTLIVDRGDDKPLERLSGFVDEQRLRDYLIGNN